MDLSKGSQRHEQQAAQQEEGDGQASRQTGLEQPTPQEELGRRSDSQDYIPLSFAQARSRGGEEERELGELPFTREQRRHAGSLSQEQRQQTAAPVRRHTTITAELLTERQAQKMAERRHKWPIFALQHRG